MAESLPETEVRCRNCGCPTEGAYCPRCGQETRLRLPTLREFVREAAGRYVAFDGRFWRTVFPLVVRPGFLTREYLAGRRRKYIRPARLYLFATLIFFAVSRFYAEPEDIINTSPEASKSPVIGQAVDEFRGELDAARERRNEIRASQQLSLDDDLNVRLPPAFATATPALKKRWERFNHLSRDEKINQLADGMLRYAPYAMFVLLPAFAFLLKVAYLGRRKRYPRRPGLYGEHMVFAAHNHALLFIVATAMLLVPFGPVRFALFVWILIYFLASMRAVYGGRWSGVVARGMALWIAYAVLFSIAVVGLLAAAVLLR